VVEESTQNGCSNDIYAKTRRNKSILSLEGKVDKCENHEIGRVFAVGSRHHLSLSFFQFVGSTSINRREAIGNLTWELLNQPAHVSRHSISRQHASKKYRTLSFQQSFYLSFL